MNKDTIDTLNKLEFFYWEKPTKTPKIEKQDREQVKKDFELIRQDLEILEILKQLLKGVKVLKNNKVDISDYVVILSESTDEKLKEWLEDE